MTRDLRQIYVPPGILDKDTEEGIISRNWREIGENLPSNSFFSLGGNFGHNYSIGSKEIREEFKNYFMSFNGFMSLSEVHGNINIFKDH